MKIRIAAELLTIFGFLLCQHAEGQSSVRIESVKYQGAECDVVQITANVDPGTVSTFSFTWFVNDGSGNTNIARVELDGGQVTTTVAPNVFPGRFNVSNDPENLSPSTSPFRSSLFFSGLTATALDIGTIVGTSPVETISAAVVSCEGNAGTNLEVVDGERTAICLNETVVFQCSQGFSELNFPHVCDSNGNLVLNSSAFPNCEILVQEAESRTANTVNYSCGGAMMGGGSANSATGAGKAYGTTQVLPSFNPRRMILVGLLLISGGSVLVAIGLLLNPPNAGYIVGGVIFVLVAVFTLFFFFLILCNLIKVPDTYKPDPNPSPDGPIPMEPKDGKEEANDKLTGFPENSEA